MLYTDLLTKKCE